MPIESSTVTNCSPPAWTSRSVRPRVGRISARAPVTACERLSLVDTCTVSRAAAHGRLGDLGVGGGGDEVAAHGEEDLGLAVAQRADGPYDVVAVLARRREAELLLQGVQEGRGGPLEDAHGAVALHVAVAAHRAHARRRGGRCCRAAAGS